MLSKTLLVDQQAANGTGSKLMLSMNLFADAAAAPATAASARAACRAVGGCRCSSGVKEERSQFARRRRRSIIDLDEEMGVGLERAGGFPEREQE